MSTFVSLGNSKRPFTRLLLAVEEMAARGRLPEPVIVQHGHTEFTSLYCKAVPFMEMHEFERHIADADLVILQAGGGSVLSACRYGKTPVVMPRTSRLSENVDDHQIENARHLEKLGKVIVAYEPAQLEGAVRKALSARNIGASNTSEPKLVSIIRSELEEIARSRSL
jgi:UDP-N-acetylglucosamine transferase subunit ALG13